ncbi:MAG: glycosyltransferase family 4 protein [Nitrospirae bacterium]|nr:MAG: glycosyltransferase family 4 protein [Nitrospirota bacterium]
MRRICVLINNTGLGGAERRLGRLFAHMADGKTDTLLVINASLWKKLQAVGVVTGREQRVWQLAEPWGRLAEWTGLRQAALGFWLRKLDYFLFACLLLVRYALAPRCLFHVVLGGTYVVLPLMLLRPDHRIIISVTNRNLAGLVGVPWALPIYRFALARCALIDALTEGVRADLVGRGLSDPKIIASPGSVVDLDHYQPESKKEPWVVFAGRLIEEKNPLLFLEAVPTILQGVPGVRCFLLGEGPLRPLVEQALDRLHLRGVVETGFRADLAPVLSRARVFVSLQRLDNYPSQSLLEAMACGATTVATDVGLTWQLVDETTGIRIKPDPEQMAQAVISLLKDPERCDRLGRAARRRVAERHSEDSYRAYLDGLYRRLDGSKS